MDPDPQDPSASAICTDPRGYCNILQRSRRKCNVCARNKREGRRRGRRYWLPWTTTGGHWPFGALPFLLSPSALTASLSFENEKKTDRVTDHVSSPDDIQEVGKPERPPPEGRSNGLTDGRTGRTRTGGLAVAGSEASVTKSRQSARDERRATCDDDVRYRVD